MPRGEKTRRIIEAARQVLTEYRPMTVRQIYYQLVASQVIENTRSQYKAVSKALVKARQEGLIPWHWVEDRLRIPHKVHMWRDVAAFGEIVPRWYRRDVWADQAQLIEVWCEKDALSGILGDVLRPLGVTLNVGRGYDGWDSIHNAAMRYMRWRHEVTILYFGDLDPSGRDIPRSLRERLEFFGIYPTLEICALLPEDVSRYNLPPDFTKPTDTRQVGFVAEFGDIAVELDALPVDVLRERVREAVESRMDMDALEEVLEREEQDKKAIYDALSTLG